MQPYQPATREQVQQLLEDTQLNGGRRKKPKKKWTVWRVISTVLSMALVLALSATLAMLVKTKAEGGYPALFGYRIFRVETGSMIPTLPVGSFLLVHQPDDPEALPVGTVITYRHEDVVITHRIVDLQVEFDEQSKDNRLIYQTKGDNPENSVDPWTVDPSDILGELIWHVSF